MRMLLAAAALLVTASCVMDGGGMEWRDETYFGKEPAAVVSSEERVRGAIGEMHAAYGRGEWDRVSMMLTPGATCYNAHTGSLHEGRDTVVRMFRAMLEHQQGEKPGASSMTGLKVRLDGPAALATYRFIEEEGGGESVSIVSHTLRLRGGAWLTSHLHWSGVAKR